MDLVKNSVLPPELAAHGSGARARVFYFMRTAACPVCRHHVRRLSELREVLAAAGVAVTILAPDEAAPAWAKDLPYPLVLGPDPYRAAGFGRTLGAIQQSGTIIADGAGVVVEVRRATLPFQAFDEAWLLRTVEIERAA